MSSKDEVINFNNESDVLITFDSEIDIESGKYEEVDDIKMCRICFEDEIDENLFIPCRCTGSSK